MFSDYDHKFQHHADTGFSYSPSYKDDSFSFEVEAQRQYVSRLKMQREKIQALYAKYDTLLNQLNKKDQIIKTQQKKIGELDYKCKNFSLMAPELEFMKSQNIEISQQNQLLKNNLSRLQNQYHNIMGQLNNKITYTADQRQEISVRNEELLERLKIVTKKMEQRQVQRTKQQKALKNTIDTLKKQLQLQKNKFFQDLAAIRSQLLLKNQQNHHLLLENSQLKNNLSQLAQTYCNERKLWQTKYQQLKYEKKKITTKLKKQINELLIKYEQQQKKLIKITEQYQILERQFKEYTEGVVTEKKIREEENFHLKMEICQEKSLFREKIMQYQAIIGKLQTDLSLSIRKQSDLLKKLQRIETSQNAKRTIRQIQRQQLEKINRIFI